MFSITIKTTPQRLEEVNATHTLAMKFIALVSRVDMMPTIIDFEVLSLTINCIGLLNVETIEGVASNQVNMILCNAFIPQIKGIPEDNKPCMPHHRINLP